MKTMLERVQDILYDLHGMSSVSDEVSILPLDSVERVELAMAAEEEFDVAISDAAAAKWATVGDIVKTVEEALTND